MQLKKSDKTTRKEYLQKYKELEKQNLDKLKKKNRELSQQRQASISQNRLNHIMENQLSAVSDIQSQKSSRCMKSFLEQSMIVNNTGPYGQLGAQIRSKTRQNLVSQSTQDLMKDLSRSCHVETGQVYSQRGPAGKKKIEKNSCFISLQKSEDSVKPFGGRISTPRLGNSNNASFMGRPSKKYEDIEIKMVDKFNNDKTGFEETLGNQVDHDLVEFANFEKQFATVDQ